jgi:UDP-N-acetyl-D-mannosaminuronic acid dehydrogenase
VDDLRESPANEVVHLLQAEGAKVKAWEPFKPNADMRGIHMASSLEEAIADADLLLLLVNHTEFRQLNPSVLVAKTHARIVLDTVNGWESSAWQAAGFEFLRLGDGKSKIVNPKS